MDEDEKFIPNPPELDGVPDLSMLTYLEMPHVLHNLEFRYRQMARKYCYTSISTILVAINPYERLPIYGPDVIEEFHSAAQQGRLPQGRPHPYGVSARSYMRLVQRRANQSIIVCGESGAGKTETTKLLMRYLALTAETSSMESSMVEQQIIAASPILEAYGNAKTVLNNNSSRFGKFTKLLYDVPVASRNGHILGSFLETYLLEKSRVVKQASNERNYHIFYFLYHGLSDEQKAELALVHPDQYFYTNQGQCSEAPGVNDVARYQELFESMGLMGIDEELQAQLWRLTIGILHLGNVKFARSGDGFCDIHPSSTGVVEIVANLWGISPQDLSKRLTTASMKVGNKKIETRVQFDNSVVNRDSIAKSLYENTFLWLCSRINAELYQVDDDEALRNVFFIGILDVFGFENFQNNSLEQFCINFTNEKLQQFFSYHIIQSEQEEYIKEAVFWTPLSIPDNMELIDMVEDKKMGFFTILDGACRAPQPTVEAFMQEFMKRHGDNPTVSVPRKKKRTQKKFVGFQLAHFADRVTYNAENFLVKNMEAVHQDTAKMLKKSESPLVTQIGGKGTKGRRRQSVTGVFAKALKSLMRSLGQTEPFFVRCVNPNKAKSSSKWDVSIVEHQLRCGGLVEALKVLKLGYPTRVPYEILYDKYHDSINNPLIQNMNGEAFATAILIAFDVSSEDYELGLTKIFFRPAKAAVLDAIMAQAGQPLTEEQNRKITQWVVMKRMRQMFGVSKIFVELRRQVRYRRAAETWEHVGRVAAIVGRSCLTSLASARGAIRERKRNGGAKAMQTYWRKAHAQLEYQERKVAVKDAVGMIWKSYEAWQTRSSVRANLDARIEERKIAEEEAEAARKAAEAEAKAAEAAEAAAAAAALAFQAADAAEVAESVEETQEEQAVASKSDSDEVTATPALMQVEAGAEVQPVALDEHVEVVSEDEVIASSNAKDTVSEDEEKLLEEKQDLEAQVLAAKKKQDQVHYESMKTRASKRDREKRAKRAARDRVAKTNAMQRNLADAEVQRQRRDSDQASTEDEVLRKAAELGVVDDDRFDYGDFGDSDDEDDDDLDRRAVSLEKKLGRFRAIARTGDWFLQYKGRRRKVRPQERFVHVVFDPDGEPVHVAWGAGSRHIRFDEIKFIAWGTKTPTLEAHRGHIDPNKCFSIVGASRSVDLAANSSVTAELWVKGLRQMIRQSDAEAEHLADEAVRSGYLKKHTRHKNTESLLKLQQQLFVMTHAAVFQQLEKERVWLIDANVQRAFNASVMYDYALRNDIPWKQWGDWIRQEIVNELVSSGRVASSRSSIQFVAPHDFAVKRRSNAGSVSNQETIRVSPVGVLGEITGGQHNRAVHEKQRSVDISWGRPKKLDTLQPKSQRRHRRSVGKQVVGASTSTEPVWGSNGTRPAMATAADDDMDERCAVM